MSRRSILFSSLLIVAVLVVLGLVAFRDRTTVVAIKSPVHPLSRPAVEAVQPTKLQLLAREIAPDAISPIARDLGAPGGNIRHDLELLNEVFVAWETNFPHEGNPVGENAEITQALAGDNRLRYAFVSPRHPAINAQGELCDRWGTPFRFHQLSGTHMEIRSAGPDRKFATSDDVEFAPGPKSP